MDSWKRRKRNMLKPWQELQSREKPMRLRRLTLFSNLNWRRRKAVRWVELVWVELV